MLSRVSDAKAAWLEWQTDDQDTHLLEDFTRMTFGSGSSDDGRVFYAFGISRGAVDVDVESGEGQGTGRGKVDHTTLSSKVLLTGV